MPPAVSRMLEVKGAIVPLATVELGLLCPCGYGSAAPLTSLWTTLGDDTASESGLELRVH